ncbi:MAG: aspartate--tRNA(Asn) ligase [Clostridia bacterium]|nr:aspartate--tRNA(Asn) ligase [Clostridia bacterium]
MEFVNFEKRQDTQDIQYIIEQVKSGAIKDGDNVTVKGSIYRIKEMSGFAFVNVRAASVVYQCIWEEGISKINIKDFKAEECVVIDGTIVIEERSRLGFDIRINDMKRVSGNVEQLPVEISNDKAITKLQINNLLDYRIITLRNQRVRAIMKISHGVLNGFRDFLRGEGFTEFVPPKIVQAGAEGGADMFEVDYFGEKAYLNQSPQMYKQIMVGVFTKVFTTSPVFRGEKHSTNRHINEFQGLDLEMGFIDSFEDLMELEARLFKYLYAYINENFGAELDIVLGKGKRLPELTCFPRIRFSEAKKLFADAHPGKYGETTLMEPDLDPNEERWLGEYFNKEYGSPIVFITHYPTIKRPFYAMEDPENPEVTLSFDMLLNGLEVTTGGQRIHDYAEQVAKMERLGMNVADFEDYLTMHKYGMPPHGGMGLGLERIVQNMLGLQNIKEATAFPRDRERLRP